MPQVIVFDTFGGPEVLHLVEEAAREPEPGEIRVRIEAFAINPLDAMMRSGNSPAPVPLPHARLGIEGTGVVDALGESVTGLMIGDAVIITAIPDSTSNGSYAAHTTIPASAVIKRPGALDIEQAAAIWVGFSTAYGALVERAGMQEGDRVLITAASGSVGRAAIQIASQIGAVPIAVTRSAAKADELRDAGAAVVIATDSESIVEAVDRETGGAGVDIALDLVTGPGQQDLIQATRKDGTLVAAGFLDARPTPAPGDAPVTVINYRGFELLADPAAVDRMAIFLEEGVRAGGLRPAIDRVFALDDIVEAHRRFDAGLHGGKKIVVTV